MNDAEYFAGSLALVPAGRAGDAHRPGVGRAIARWHEGELARQRVRLAGLQARLAGRERELAALQGGLEAFAARFRQAVGRYFGELDAVEAEIADLLAQLCPAPPGVQAREGPGAPGKPGALAATSAGAERARTLARLSGAIKKLYHELARRVHPDLAADEGERGERTRLMAEVNRAYEAGDVARLEALLREWEQSPGAVAGAGVEAELDRVGRSIAWIEERLRAIAAELLALRRSELWRFRAQVEQAAREGRDLLAEMAAAERAKIAAARQRLATLARRLEEASRKRPARVLEFPADRSLGTLFVRGHGGEPGDAPWEELGAACGRLAVSPGADVRLRVRRKADLAPLGALQADDLQALDLRDSAVTGAGLPHLRGLTGLQELDLSRNEITDLGLDHLGALTGLRRLDLSRCYIGDAGLAALGHLSALEHLALAGPYVTDAGLPHLRAFPLLRELDLSHSAVTDAGLAHLAALTTLRRLHLAGSGVSRAGKAALQRALPECAIA